MKEKLNITQIKERLANQKTPLQWRSLDELADTKEFKAYFDNEFPQGAANFDDENETGLSRRDFMKLMGAAFVMASLPGCAPQPLEKIVPYVSRPEEIIPGKATYFATAMEFNGHATGLLVESHMGRPTHIQGNPSHPDSLGATNAIIQGSILGLYDPERSQNILKGNKKSNWATFTFELSRLLENAQNENKNIRILTPTIVSPTLSTQIQQFLQKYPRAQWVQYQSVNKDAARRAQKAVFGRFVDSLFNFKNADVVLSLGSDFMSTSAGSLRYAKEFMAGRTLSNGESNMNRLYAMDITPTHTGAVADHALPTDLSDLNQIVETIAAGLGVSGVSSHHLSEKQQLFVDAVIDDLSQAKGSSLIIAGEQMPEYIQALTYLLNEKLNNVGSTINYIKAIDARPTIQVDELKSLVQDSNDGKVDTLFILGSNPFYDAPGDIDVSEALSKIDNIIHFGLYEDETAQYADWHIPAAHYLEHFSDSRASDGTITMMQPLIAPLFGGKSIHEFLAAMLGSNDAKSYDLIRQQWSALSDNDFRKAIHDGLVHRSAYAKENISVNADQLNALKQNFGQNIGLTFIPDPFIWDGQFSNNAWLQETPKPFTKLTWDNAALISPSFAEEFNLTNGDMVTITGNGNNVDIPVWIVPGHANNMVTLSLGYGRKKAGFVGKDKGFDISSIRSSKSMSYLSNVIVKPSGKTYELASTQLHNSMKGRHLVRQADLKHYLENPFFADAYDHSNPSRKYRMFDGYKNTGDYAWGMTINLGACMGCNACVTACQSENNIPTVGKSEVLNGRELHWVRIDNYYEGDLDNPDLHHQPVMCQQCENAPCEPVCPVGATQHSDEGLNDMAYNRCVGTRYCSNNCPYKVRRFNFYQYADKETPTYQLRNNPDVTVRNRGVMEKCTFCVQRINEARITARTQNRKIKDGEIVTACQSACPTDAIVFGDLMDVSSKVSKLKRSSLNYGLLTELNTQPRLTYLAKVKNTHHVLAKKSTHDGHHEKTGHH